MKIADIPLDERPRERLLAYGAQALTDAELLAVFLRSGSRGKSAITLAHELLDSFGGLSNLLNAEQSAVCKFTGLGSAKYCQLRASLELSHRYTTEPLKRGPILTTTLATQKFLINKLRHQKHEVFACLFLDSRNHLLSYEELFHGTVNSANIHLRTIIERALAHPTVGIIFAHNHPSGDPTPSDADKSLTQDFIKALSVLDISVKDHIIVGNTTSFSFAEEGELMSKN
jgi:DNA repair protein RadC